MNTKMLRRACLSLGIAMALLAAVLLVSTALAEGPDDGSRASGKGGLDPTFSFSYQGRLFENGQPANGTYDFRVTLWDVGGTLVGSCMTQTTEGIPVRDGVFSLYLYPAQPMSQAFSGEGRYIQVAVSPAGAGTYTWLDSQPIVPVPYAWSLRAGGVISQARSIHSLGWTHLAINPFDIEATNELPNNETLTFLHDWRGYTGIENDLSSGSSTVYVPVHNLTQLLGTPLKLNHLEVCYKVNTALSYIDETRVYYAASWGGRMEILYDGDNRDSTTWSCYAVYNDTPTAIGGPLLVHFRLYFPDTGTGEEHVITIGRITATLVE